MSSGDETYFRRKTLHRLLAGSALALLAVVGWMVLADHDRPWKRYQRTFRQEVEPRLTEARLRKEQAAGGPNVARLERQLEQQRPTWLKRLAGLPLVDALGRTESVEQIWLPELTLDYHFARVPRFDRCVTCHLGIDRPNVAGTLRVPSASSPSSPLQADSTGSVPATDLPHPYRGHPRLDLFVGASSPHPMAEFGCTICHDGQGSATDFSWASHMPDDPRQQAEWRRQHAWFFNPHWDQPMLPARLAESRCLQCHHDLTDLEPSRRFPDPPAPKLLAGYQLVRRYGCFGCHEIKGIDDSGRRVGPELRPEPQGTLRKVGPALGDVASRLSPEFLQDVVADPTRFRPQTRMPVLFGLHDHLDELQRADSARREAVEVRAIGEYLRAVSRPVEPLPAAKATAAPSAERGQRLFQTQGCLACHRHSTFPEGQSDQGPDLSRLGAKYADESGRRWLADWLRDPARHAPRTRMPNPLLEPAAVADVAAWLASFRDWQAQPACESAEEDLDRLAAEYLGASLPAEKAAEYLAHGIPDSQAGAIPGDARLLAGPISRAKKLQYVGRCTIRKRGCFGCHDIPGLEDAQPVGPALSDWGRKPAGLLAFERIDRYVGQSERQSPVPGSQADQDRRAFFREALLAHRREGFLWQKLHEPRSFDFQQAGSKPFNQQLTMGRFTLSDDQCEAIATFVLGLTGEAPTQRYVYQPPPRQRAIVEGRKVLDDFGCAQCHTLEMERWTVEQGERRTELVGMPRVDANGRRQEDEDDDGHPLWAFSLWEPATLGGKAYRVGGPDVLVGQQQLVVRRPPVGGTFARLLFPVALAEARAVGANGALSEAWGWVPPGLAYIGRQVQPQWMYDYLLRPTVIRPAAVLHMPQFQLSGDEACKLADYFAAAAGREFPYSVSGTPDGTPRADDAARRGRMEQALRLLHDRKTYCGKCHLVGEDGPGGESRSVLAPNLDQVGRRIRPDYLRRWLTDPKSVVPYTAMPENFPATGPPLGQDLLPGTSPEQLDAVLDLLLNYDWFLARRK